jgi:hypothetical protein
MVHTHGNKSRHFKYGEAELQDKDDAKRHWSKKMCNKFKKPIEKPGAANDFIMRCQRVHLQILKRNESSFMRAEDSGDDDSDSCTGEARVTKMARLSKEGSDVEANDDDVEVPILPPIEDSQFYAEKEDNAEAGAVDMDVSNTCGDSANEAVVGSDFTEAVTTPTINVAA